VPPVQAAAAALKHRFKLRANMIMMDNDLRFILMIRKFTGEFKSPDIIAHDTGHVNGYTTLCWYYSPSPEYPVACRSEAEIPLAGQQGWKAR